LKPHGIIGALFCVLLSFFSFVGPLYAEMQEKPLRVAFDRDFPPFSFIDEQENSGGFVIDLLQMIARRHGIKLAFVPMSLESAVTALEQGHVDVIAGIKYSQKMENSLDFSEPFFTMSDVLIVHRHNDTIYNLSNLSGRVVAVQRGDLSADLVGNVRRVKIHGAFTQPDALYLLHMDRADAFIGERWSAEYLMRMYGWKDQMIVRSSVFMPSDYSFAVRNGNTSLIVKLNEGISYARSDGTYSILYNQWINPLAKETDNQWHRIAIALLVVLSLIMVLLLFGAVWNNRLRSEVRKQTRAIQDNMVFQRQVLESVDNGIVALDNHGIITMVNNKAREMLNWPGEDSAEKWASNLPEKVLPVLPGDFPPVGTPLYKRDVVITTRNAERYFEVYMAALEDRGGHKAGWIVTMRDRTEEKALNMKLVSQEKLRALGHLVSGVAHELRNPLTAIKAFVDLIPYKIDNPRFREEMLLHVPEEINRLNRIVEDLYDYTRRRELKFEPVPVSELAQSVLSLLAKKIHDAGIEVQREIDPGQTLLVDRQRIKQVLINLIVNAVESMQECSRRVICIKGSDNRIIIADTGVGIYPEARDQLFQPFHTTKTDGVGLGLFISYSIMKQHNGDIAIESVRDEGTSVVLTFDVREEYICRQS